jgi:hypothetical protein
MSRQFALLLFLPALIVTSACSDTEIRVAPYDVIMLPGQYDFGAVAVGSEFHVVLTLTNQASGTAEIGNITLGGSGGGHFVLPASFDGDLGGSASLDIELVFAPQAEGYWEDVLIIAIINNDAQEVIEVPIRGNGVTTALRTYPELLDFGPVDVDDSEDMDITVENLTGVDLEIWGFDINGDDDGFDIDTPIEFDVFPWIVPAGGELELTVVYEANDLEPRDAGLTLLGLAGVELGSAIDLRANDCEGSTHPDWDHDNDGVTQCAGDCDDDDPNVNPGLPEVPDLIDNDCNGLTDDTTELYDDDGDGFSEAEGDCNDDNVTTYPGAEEVADGQDNDCDGDVDEGTTADDSDGDGYTIPAGDCDDNDATVYPNAPEGEDGIDNDCNGLIDDTTSVYDDDGDGYCENDTTCLGGWTPGDCNDGDPDAYPGNVEVLNGADDDCDGIVDNGTDATDDDGDGYTELGGDCDDSDPDTYPGAVELPDGVDNDCDGVFDEGTVNVDDDGDGYSENGGDCNDADPGIYPGAPEDYYATSPDLGDGIDNNCNLVVDEGTLWYDDDGDGFSEVGGDCDDTSTLYSPAVWDPPGDGNDWDCDGND